MAAHRYWRLLITSNNGSGTYTSVASLELRTTSGGSNLSVTGNGTAYSSSVYSGNVPSYGPANAFDNNSGTWAAMDPSFPQWVKWDFGAANEQDIGHLSVVNTGSVSNTTYPVNVVLQYSDDDSAWSPWIFMTNGTSAGTTAKAWEPLPEADFILAPPMGALMALGGGTTVAAAPLGILAGRAGGTAAASAPFGSIFGRSGAVAGLSVPMQRLVATGYRRNTDGIPMKAPMPVLVVLAGAVADGLAAPSAALAASATVPTIAHAALQAPMGTLQSSTTVSASARADLSSPLAFVVVVAGARANLAPPSPVMSAASSVGAVARADLIAPMGQVQAVLNLQNIATANLFAPMPGPASTARAYLAAPMGLIEASASVVVAVVREAYATNLQPSAGYRESAVHEVTRYTGLAFDSILRHQGRYYGVKADGVYLLEGDTDGGAAIAWTLQTGTSDLGSGQMKACRQAVVYGRVGAGLKASATVGERTPQTYGGIVEAAAGARATRVKLGKGLKAVYWSFGLSDPAGGPADIDSLQFDAAELTRKVF